MWLSERREERVEPPGFFNQRDSQLGPAVESGSPPGFGRASFLAPATHHVAHPDRRIARRASGDGSTVRKWDSRDSTAERANGMGGG
jgi:hypothetical protein